VKLRRRPVRTVHLASWAQAELPLAADLIAGNTDVRPDGDGDGDGAGIARCFLRPWPWSGRVVADVADVAGQAGTHDWLSGARRRPGNGHRRQRVCIAVGRADRDRQRRERPSGRLHPRRPVRKSARRRRSATSWRGRSHAAGPRWDACTGLAAPVIRRSRRPRPATATGSPARTAPTPRGRSGRSGSTAPPTAARWRRLVAGAALRWRRAPMRGRRRCWRGRLRGPGTRRGAASAGSARRLCRPPAAGPGPRSRRPG
jgi:hypothetical protein